MPQHVKSAIMLAVWLISVGAHANASDRQTSPGQQADNPFGYERQRQKMMRPVNDLLPADEVQAGREGLHG